MTQIQNAFAPDQTNHHGTPCFGRSTREQARNFLRCGTLSGTFYVSQKNMANQQLLTLRRLADEDPAALAEEAIAAREDGFMRTEGRRLQEPGHVVAVYLLLNSGA